MTEYKLFAQRVGLVGITNLIVNRFWHDYLIKEVFQQV